MTAGRNKELGTTMVSDYLAGSRALMKSAIRLAAGGSRFDSTAIV